MAVRRLTIQHVEQVAQGSSRGRPWTLYKVTALDAQGSPIPAELTCFEALPVGETIELEVKRRDGGLYGESFTLSRPRAGGALRHRIERLERRVDVLESTAV